MNIQPLVHFKSAPLFKEDRSHLIFFGEKPHFRQVTPTYWECVGRGVFGYGGTADEAKKHWEAKQQ